MKIQTPPKLAINSENPFKDDLFEREELAKILTQMVSSINDPFVLAINAGWGEGKTTFLEMWKCLLEKEKYQVVYIDVFSKDYAAAPFSFIADALISYYESIAGSRKAKIQKLRESAKDACIQLSRGIVKFGSKAFVKAYHSDPSADAALEASGEIIANLIPAGSNKSWIDPIDKFKSCLSDLRSVVGEASGSKLIIMIDELDRCRPTVALEILEKIKHVFLVNDVVFILGLHRVQLEICIKQVYGDAIDAREYLQKFISYEIELPSDNSQSPAQYVNKYSDKLIKHFGLHDNQNGAHATAKFIKDYLPEFNPTKREIERIFLNCAVYIWGLINSDVCVPELAAILLILKTKDPNSLAKIAVGQKGHLIQVLNSDNGPLRKLSSDGRYINLKEILGFLMVQPSHIPQNITGSGSRVLRQCGNDWRIASRAIVDHATRINSLLVSK